MVAELKEAIEQLKNGSTEAVTDVTLIALQHRCTFSQFQQISTALYGVLDVAHLQEARRTKDVPFQQAMALRSLASTLPEWVKRKTYATRTISNFSTRWSALHDWIIFLKTQYIDQESVDLDFRIVTKRCIVDFFGLCRHDILGDMFNVVISSEGIMATLFALWRLECQDRRFSPCLAEDDLPPPIFNIPSTLDAWMCTFANNEKWNWPEILRPFGGDGKAVASTALDHLQHDVAQIPIDYDRIIWDIHLMTTLSVNDAIRLPLLNLRSMTIVAGVVMLMVGQRPSNKERPLVAKCISYACWYMRAYLETTDGLPWVTQVVEADLLRTFLLAEPWMKHSKDKIEEDWEPLLLLLAKLIPKYSLFRPVLRPMVKSLESIDAVGLPAKIKKDGPLLKAWATFEKVVRCRADLFRLDEKRSDTDIDTCENAQCNNLGPAGTFKRCAKCLSVLYCSKECQTYDWKSGGHSINCKDIQARRENGTLLRLSIRDLRFIDQIIAHDLKFFSGRINEIVVADDVNPIVIEIDYTDIPMKFGIGSVSAMPAPQTCQRDDSMRKKWDSMVDFAQKSPARSILIRAFIPAGSSLKVKLQILPLKYILPDYNSTEDLDTTGFNATFDHLYSCTGLSFGIVDSAFEDEATTTLGDKTGALTVQDTGLDALD